MKCGYGDLRLLIGNEEIKTFKFVLCVCNETFRKIINDPLFKEPLEISEGCSLESYLLLEKWYQRIEINITDKNCVDFLFICVCYNENLVYVII